MKDRKWEGKPFKADGVLTVEIIEEAAKRVLDEFGRHPCYLGHLIVGPHNLRGAKHTYCLICGLKIVLDKK